MTKILIKVNDEKKYLEIMKNVLGISVKEMIRQIGLECTERGYIFN